MLIVDSMGIEDKVLPVLNDAVTRCARVFGKDVPIYLDATKRQHVPSACQSFALQDVHELFTIMNYLEAQYHGDIFEFVEKNGYKTTQGANRTHSIGGIHVRLCPLPLSFYTYMHSTRVMVDKDAPHPGIFPANRPWRN